MPTVDSKKFLNYAGVSHLWSQIKSRLDTKLEGVSAADDSVTVTGSGLTKSVGVQISAAEGNALSLKTTGSKGLFVEIPAAAQYTIAKDTSSSDYAAVYTLQKDGVDVGAAINIPKDMVVSSGQVVTNPSGQTAGTYIELTLANATNDKIYINVGDLIEYVTSGSSSGDMVVVAIDANHQVTASITDGTVTKAKLVQGVQDSLDLADSALQAADIAEGSTNGTISVDGTDVAVHGLGSAAYAATTAFDAAGAADAVLGTNADTASANTVYGAKAYAADQAAAVLGTNADTASSNTVYGAKAYADSLFANGALTNAEIDQAIAEAEA